VFISVRFDELISFISLVTRHSKLHHYYTAVIIVTVVL